MTLQEMIERGLRHLTAGLRIALRPRRRDDTRSRVRALASTCAEMATDVDFLLGRYMQLVQPALACARGCDHCCHVQISPTVPELFMIVSAVRQLFSEDEISSLLARCQELQAQYVSLGREELQWRRERCVLLTAAGTCSIYQSRPLGCRGWNSTDVAPCKIQRVQPGAARVELNRGYFELPMLFKSALIDVMVEQGRGDDTQVPLYLGLPLALREAALERWLENEEDVFASCAIRPPIVHSLEDVYD